MTDTNGAQLSSEATGLEKNFHIDLPKERRTHSSGCRRSTKMASNDLQTPAIHLFVPNFLFPAAELHAKH